MTEPVMPVLYFVKSPVQTVSVCARKTRSSEKSRYPIDE
jgi:hypothetical protein